MADRSVHYERAFEAYLRHRKLPYVAVDEAKRAVFGVAKLKNFDFVVYSQAGPNRLIDIKGRVWRGRTKTPQSWATEADVTDLAEWQRVFGEGFLAMLVFAYWVDTPPLVDETIFVHGERSYRMFAVGLDEYRAHMRRRSEKWGTVSLSASDFRELARPLDQVL